MISLHFTNEPVRDFASAAKGANDYFKQFFHGMLKRGVYLPPSAYESWFLCNALTYEDIEKTLETFQQKIVSIVYLCNNSSR